MEVTESPGPARLPAAFWWLLAGALLSAFATFVFPFLTFFLRSRGFSVTEAGLVAGMVGGGSIFSGPTAGHLADRLGRRPVIVGSLLTTAALTALLAVLRAPPMIAASTLLLGLVGNAYRPAASALVADLVSPDQRARAYGLLHWSANIGIASSFAVGGMLATRSYASLFLADAATTLAFAGIVLWRIPETRPGAGASGEVAPDDRGYRAVVRDDRYLVLLGLLLLLLMPFCQFMVAVPVAMNEQGHSPATYGRVMAVNGVLIGLSQPALLRWTGRLDPARVLASAAVFVGVGFGAYAVCRSAWAWAAATAIWTVGEILLFPTFEAVVASLAPEKLRGRYQGLVGVAFGVGFAAAPPLGGAVLSKLGATALWAACLAIALAVAAGHLLAGRARRQQATRRSL